MTPARPADQPWPSATHKRSPLPNTVQALGESEELLGIRELSWEWLLTVAVHLPIAAVWLPLGLLAALGS